MKTFVAQTFCATFIFIVKVPICNSKVVVGTILPDVLNIDADEQTNTNRA